MIRPLAVADLPALGERLAALPLMQRYGRTAEKLEAALAAALRRGEGLLVAEEGGVVTGLAWFLPSGTLALGGYLKLIAVLGDGQGRGTGAALLEAFEAAVARESAHAFLLVSDFNEAAQRFYARRGYVRVGALPGLVLPDVGEALYWKRLR
jgi:ribosomal protein S18 acetylase RimI-like enzyme